MFKKLLQNKVYSRKSQQEQSSTHLSPSVRKLFGYWRKRVMLSLIVGYAAFYLVRLNFSMTIPSMMEEFSISKSHFGAILSLSSMVYGVGRLLNGYICDRTDSRKLMALGLIGCAVANVFMSFGASLGYFAFFWTINSYLQSTGSPVISKTLSSWFSSKELGTKWGIWNSSHQIGGAAVFVLAGYLVTNHSWQYAFIVPAIMAGFVGICLYWGMRESPRSIGLPTVEAYSKLKPLMRSDNAQITRTEIKQMFCSKPLWCVSFGNMFLYIVRIGIFNWAPTFLKEIKGLSLITSGWQSALFEIAGLVGGICAGWISDNWFNARRAPVSVVCMLLLAVALTAFWYAPADTPLLSSIIMFVMGFVIYGPQVLVVVAAADFASANTKGLANGFVGMMGYIGGSVSGLGIGLITDHYGWSAGFLLFVCSSILGALCFIPIWNHTTLKKK